MTTPPSQTTLLDLLSRLEHTLHTDPRTPLLRHSAPERQKVSTNLSYARDLLQRLEQEPGARANSKLKEGRVRLGRLQERLDELGRLDDGESEGESDEEVEEILRRFAPAVGTVGGIEFVGDAEEVVSGGAGTRTDEQANAAAAVLSSNLRARGTNAPTSTSSATTTGTSSSLPPAPPSTTTFNPTPPTTTTQAALSANSETLLSHHASEQEALTTSLLTLATRLKESTLAFSTTLDASDPIVDRAAAALDKNVSGMEAAGRRMGTLRRMTEGIGWWGRLSLWARVAVGWVVLILIMFVMPKLRF